MTDFGGNTGSPYAGVLMQGSQSQKVLSSTLNVEKPPIIVRKLQEQFAQSGRTGIIDIYDLAAPDCSFCKLSSLRGEVSKKGANERYQRNWMRGCRMELWNPREPIEIDPDRFERLVVDWLRKAEPSSVLTHQARLAGKGGEYNLDALAEIELFGGAKIRILIECKKHTRPVDRDTIHTVHSKMQSLHIHKAIVFSTSGFQRGAIAFATEFSIGLVTVKDGAAVYHTRSATQSSKEMLPYWVPEFAGELLSASKEVIHVSTFTMGSADALRAFLVRA